MKQYWKRLVCFLKGGHKYDYPAVIRSNQLHFCTRGCGVEADGLTIADLDLEPMQDGGEWDPILDGDYEE